MIAKVFIDSDVILDVALAREPFFADSQAVLNLAEAEGFLGFTSPNSITNVYFIFKKMSSSMDAKNFIKDLMEIIEVANVDNEVIMEALDSRFFDFEDSVQHFCAVKSRCDYIVTRNVKDYSYSQVQVLEPKELLLLLTKENRPT